MVALVVIASPLFSQTNFADLQKKVDDFGAKKKAVEQVLSGKETTKAEVKTDAAPVKKESAKATKSVSKPATSTPKKASKPVVKKTATKKVSEKKEVTAEDVWNSAKKAVQ